MTCELVRGGAFWVGKDCPGEAGTLRGRWAHGACVRHVRHVRVGHDEFVVGMTSLWRVRRSAVGLCGCGRYSVFVMAISFLRGGRIKPCLVLNDSGI